MPIDDADRRILRALQDEPTLPITALAERVGLSHTPCWRRLKRLERDGVIVARALLLDARQLGFQVNVFANLKLKQHDEATLEAFEQEVSEHPQIVECFSMSGSSDYILRVVVQGIDEYEAFLKKVLLHLPGVSSIESSFALKSVKLTTRLPI